MSLSKQLAVTSATYHPYGREDVLDGAEGAGFKFVELVSARGAFEHVDLEMDDRAVRDFQAQLERHQLKLSALGASTGLMSAEGVARAKHSVDLARKLGVQIVVNSIAGPTSHDESIDLFMEHVDEAAEYAGKMGVILALELHGNHTGNGRQMLEVVRRINHPSVKINYDTANAVYHGGEWPYEDLELALPEVVNIHLKDKIGGKGVWQFPPIGKGEIDFRRVFDILDRGGYSGPMSIEIEFSEGGWPSVPEVHEAVKRARQNVLHLLELHW